MTKILIGGLATIHLAASLWHGSAHTQLAIVMPPDKNAFVYVVIVIAPIVAAGLIWTRVISIRLASALAAAFSLGSHHAPSRAHV